MTMDGLSAAGGVLAIVTLAIQLVGTVGGIRHFIKNVVDAPKEQQKLASLLDLLELLLQVIQATSERETSRAMGRQYSLKASVTT